MGVLRRGPIEASNYVEQGYSISSAGDFLGCSSLNSTDIKNCNTKFWKKYEQEVASKVWHQAVELGVELNEEVGVASKTRGAGGSTMEECIFEIQENEKREPKELEGSNFKLFYYENCIP
jgi:hypothetical protein